jgi:hypothetical protein
VASAGGPAREPDGSSSRRPVESRHDRGARGVADRRANLAKTEAKVQTQADGSYAVLVKVALRAKSGRLWLLFVAT